MKFKHLAMIAITAIALSGCVAQWQNVTKQNQKISQSGMSLELPVGWVVIKPNKKLHLVSNDGPGLNSVAIETITLKDMTKTLKVPVNGDMDMLETSKKFLSYWSKSNNISEFDVLVEDYVETNGKGQYYVEWSFKDDEGATMRAASQGTILGDSIVHVGYSAPKIHYYDKYLQDFKSILNSIEYL